MTTTNVKLGYRTTAIQALRGADLSNKIAVVTGGNAGIGVETVRALATAGADVVIACRNTEAGRRVVAELQPGVKGKLSVQALDLADLASVQAAGAALASSLPRLDFLVLNAGVMAVPKSQTKDGFEMQFGVNHLGHFALAQQLLPLMTKTGGPGRVVAVSSSAHGWGSIGDNPGDGRKFYGRGWGSYGDSKLANVLFARELSRRLAAEGSSVEAFSLHPGIAITEIGSHMGCRASCFYGVFGWSLKTPAQGAATTAFACVAPELKGQGGAYLQDCAVSKPYRNARSDKAAEQLWVKSEELVADALKRRGLA